MAITIKTASTPEDYELIFHLRYEIYVQEMGRKQTFADHTWKRIEEPYDAKGLLLMAMDEDKIVGTVRCNFRKDGPLECEELYELDRFADFYPDQISMTTKLMVKREYRNSVAASLLATSAYMGLRDGGAKLDFIDTNPHLVRLYQQMGYRLYKDNINHPDYGNVIPMVFLLDDFEYMTKINSPFRRYAKRFENTSETSSYFEEYFKEYAYIRPLFSLNPDELWNSYSLDLHKPPEEVLSFLKNFSLDECKQLLSQLDMIIYKPGDYVFQQGDESSGMFCILEGQVEVIADTDQGEVPVAVLTDGEIFGELGFFSTTKRNASIRAKEKSNILILNPQEYQKLKKNNPEIALKMMENLFEILTDRFRERSKAFIELQQLFDNILSAEQREEIAESF